MLLAVDVGNTSTVLGLFEGETMRASWRASTDRNRMADQYAILVKNLLELDKLKPPDQAIISSVMPHALREAA